MWPNPQFSADLVKFTEEILNGKFQFLCSAPTVGALLMKAQRDTILGAQKKFTVFFQI